MWVSCIKTEIKKEYWNGLKILPMTILLKPVYSMLNNKKRKLIFIYLLLAIFLISSFKHMMRFWRIFPILVGMIFWQILILTLTGNVGAFGGFCLGLKNIFFSDILFVIFFKWEYFHTVCSAYTLHSSNS